MSDWIVSEAVDLIEVTDETRQKISEAMLFASQETKRFRNFMKTFAYAMSWGKTEDDLPTRVAITPDFVKHSFIFYIWTYRYDVENNRTLRTDAPFTLAMIFDKGDNRWSCHS